MLPDYYIINILIWGKSEFVCEDFVVVTIYKKGLGPYSRVVLKAVTQWWTLVELCHEILTVTAIQMVKPCSNDHFSEHV